MTTESSPDDDPFDDLFRDEPVPQAAPDQTVAPTLPPPEAAAAGPAVQQSVPREPMVDTGRLFRSVRADDRADTMQAVSRDEARRLRTLRDADDEPRPAAVLVSAPPDVAEGEQVVDSEERGPRMRRRRSHRVGGSGLRSLGVVVVVGLATVIAGLIDAFAFGPGLGPVTGIVLLIASVLAALRVRRDDASVAVITPPLAYLVAAVTVGQIGVVGTGGAIGRVVDVFFTLADNWIWIVGSAVAAAVIVLVRSRQSD